MLSSVRPKKRISVQSFDFDGCLFNPRYVEHYKAAPDADLESVFFDTNKRFFATVKAKVKSYNEVVYFVGSNRQSYFAEKTSFARGGSSFSKMEPIRKYLGVGKVNRFLMADLYADRPHGTSFIHTCEELSALKSDFFLHEHFPFIFDNSKTTLLYAQLHKMASENPNALIVFEFYDDNDPILQKLKQCFADSSLLPWNVSLKLHYYAGDSIEPIASIQGTGKIDYEYTKTVKKIARLCGGDLMDLFKSPKIDAADRLGRIIKSPYIEELHSSQWSRPLLAATVATAGFFATGGVGMVVGGAVVGALIPDMVATAARQCYKK